MSSFIPNPVQTESFKFKSLETDYDNYCNAIRNGDIETAYLILIENSYVLDAVANNSENSRIKIFELGFLGDSAKKIFDLIINAVHETKISRIIGNVKIDWESVLEYAKNNERISVQQKSVDQSELEFENWLIDTVITDILTAENPNKKNLFHMYPHIDLDYVNSMDVETYYEHVFNFIKTKNINIFKVFNVIIDNPGYLYYFLSGDEYEKYFKIFFENLSLNDRYEIYESILDLSFQNREHILEIKHVVKHLNIHVNEGNDNSEENKENEETIFELFKEVEEKIDELESDKRFLIKEKSYQILKKMKKTKKELNDEENDLFEASVNKKVYLEMSDRITETEKLQDLYRKSLSKFMLF